MGAAEIRHVSGESLHGGSQRPLGENEAWIALLMMPEPWIPARVSSTWVVEPAREQMLSCRQQRWQGRAM